MPDSQVGQVWAEYFKTEAESYRINAGMTFLRKFTRSPFMQLPVRYAGLTRESRVLEAGCASGKFSVCFAMLGCNVTALDFSAAMLDNAAALKHVVEAETGPLNLALQQGDLENLELESDQFDLVINEGVVEHWLDDTERRKVLANMVRVTRSGGTMAIIIPNGHHPRMTYWINNSPAFLSAPPMVRYNPELLLADLETIGLSNVMIDGIYAWHTLDQWPTGRFRHLAGSVLQRLMPLPRKLRLKWGIHLIGMGRKL
jgi:SAM-dependent methyltransferase